MTKLSTNSIISTILSIDPTAVVINFSRLWGTAIQLIFKSMKKHAMKKSPTHSHEWTEETYEKIKATKTGVNYNARRGNWTIISPEGYEFKTDNLAQFCREHKLHRGHLSQLANGKRNYYKGFKVSKEV